MIGDALPCGPDLDHHVEMLRAYADAGYDELYISQIGPTSPEFFKVYEREVLPELRRISGSSQVL
jgi:hypothetical protein